MSDPSQPEDPDETEEAGASFEENAPAVAEEEAPTSLTTRTHVRSTDGLFEFDTSERSDVGCIRKVNEDSVLAAPKSGLWLVADGMGGHAAGDFASQSIVGQMETLGIPAGALDLRARFMRRLSTANASILTHSVELGKGAIGSTVAALLIQQDHYACIWSGDSRVYRYRQGQLTRVTRDHTEVQQLIDNGTITEDQAFDWPQRNVITRAIGVTDVPECDMVEGGLADGDIFLLCSDGLTEYYHDSELEGVLARTPPDALDVLCDQLIETAKERGGKDNVSVIIVRCLENQLPRFAAQGVFPEMGGGL
ncbi:MAG: SpoIIE family protein phosphatase [Pseudomonadota bacterium]